MTPGQVQYLTAAHGLLTAVRTGAGRDLVLLHSLLTDRRAFDPVLPTLTAKFRVTLFNMTLTDAITNVTLTSTPALITRQRANFGSSRSRGAEVEYSHVFRNGWNASAGYQFADATLSTGARTPQVCVQKLAAVPTFEGVWLDYLFAVRTKSWQRGLFCYALLLFCRPQSSFCFAGSLRLKCRETQIG